MNSQANPAKRGDTIVIYGTGMGAVAPSGVLSGTVALVSATLSGNYLPVAFAGLAPGFVGLYQVNVTIPSSTAPGLAQSLILSQNGQSSNTVILALQ